MTIDRPDFEPGTLVRVRSEPTLSEVVLPATRKCEPPEDELPQLLICCAPVALIRTPVGTGVLRWVELRDLAAAEAEQQVDATDRSTDDVAS